MFFFFDFVVNPIYRTKMYCICTIGCVRVLVLSVTVLALSGTLADCAFGIGGGGTCIYYRHPLKVGRVTLSQLVFVPFLFRIEHLRICV